MHRPRFVLPQLAIAILTVVVMRWCPRYSRETPPIVKDTFAEAPLDPTWQCGQAGGSFLTVSEGIHITAGSNQRPHVRQCHPVPSGATHLLVSGNAQAKDVRLGNKPWKGGRCLLYFPDTSGVVDWSLPHTAVKLTDTTEWVAFSSVFPVPPDAEQFEIRIENAGKAGTFSVRDLAVQTLHVATSFVALRWLLGACWTAMALFFLIRSLRCQGVRALFVGIPVLFILIGVVLPNSRLFCIVHAARRPIEQVFDAPHTAAETPSSGLAPGVPARIRTRHTLGLTKRAAHVGLFALLALGSCACVFAARADRRCLHMSIIRLAIPLTVFAACTEVAQMLTLDRSAKLRDWCLDVTGLAVGLFIGWLIIRHGPPKPPEKHTGEEETTSRQPTT